MSKHKNWKYGVWLSEKNDWHRTSDGKIWKGASLHTAKRMLDIRVSGGNKSYSYVAQVPPQLI